MTKIAKSVIYAAALSQAMGGSVGLEGGSKNGYTHKQQIGWHGAGFALYAWIIDGQLCMVGEQVSGGSGGSPNGALQKMNLGFIAACELASKVPGLAAYFSEFPAGAGIPATADAAGLSRTLSYPNFVAPNNGTYTPPAGGSGNTGGTSGGNGGSTNTPGTTTPGGTSGGFFSTYKTPLLIGGSVLLVAVIAVVAWLALKK